MIYEKCRDILVREYELIGEAAGIQEKIRNAVSNRLWDDFHNHVHVMNSIEKKLTDIENEREQLFTSFEMQKNHAGYGEKDPVNRFYEITAFLPENQRNDLYAIYRSLKMEALKLRIANDTLMVYLSGIKSTYKDFLDLFFPDRGGKIYTKAGTHIAHDMRSMVVNQSF